MRLFERLDRQEKSGDSYRREEDLNLKIMQQNEENIHLKKKVQELKKKEEVLEKNLTKQAGPSERKPQPKSMPVETREKREKEADNGSVPKE